VTTFFRIRFTWGLQRFVQTRWYLLLMSFLVVVSFYGGHYMNAVSLLISAVAIQISTTAIRRIQEQSARHWASFEAAPNGESGS